MSRISTAPLLLANDPQPVVIENESGASPFLLLCDHAGQGIPTQLGDLGLPPGELDRHIGWDIGALAVSRQLSALLDAPLIHQHYSRLVIDCNRQPGVASSIPELSELTSVPANQSITPEQALARQTEIFDPYHQTIKQQIERRLQRQQPTVVIAMHSFTPVFKGIARPWPIGVLVNRHPEFTHALVALLREEGDLLVGVNEPYAMSDIGDYTLPVHAEARQLPYVGIELRQDLVTDIAGQTAWAQRLARLFPLALQRFNG